MTTTPDSATFDAIVAAFHEHPQCERTTFAGVGCQRPARWRLNLHHCEQMNLCGQHKNAWIKRANAFQRAGRTLCCYHCRREFDCVADVVRVVAI